MTTLMTATKYILNQVVLGSLILKIQLMRYY
jgi:hypothetical protein